MLAFPHEWLQNHSNICIGVFVKSNSCRPSLRFLRVAASSNPAAQGALRDKTPRSAPNLERYA
jgi:hypothetical protein